MRLWLAIVLEILAISPVFSRDSPTKCQKAIINCCNPDTKLPLPLRSGVGTQRQEPAISISDVSRSISALVSTGQEEECAHSRCTLR